MALGRNLESDTRRADSEETQRINMNPKYMISKPWVHALSLLIALGSLGWVVGWFVGQTGFESAVLAVVLSAILPLGGGLLGFMFVAQRENGSRLRGVTVNISFVLFIILLFFGTLQGRYERDFVTAVITAERFGKYFEVCSNAELRVNENRKHLGLPPLKSEVFCK